MQAPVDTEQKRLESIIGLYSRIQSSLQSGRFPSDVVSHVKTLLAAPTMNRSAPRDMRLVLNDSSFTLDAALQSLLLLLINDQFRVGSSLVIQDVLVEICPSLVEDLCSFLLHTAAFSLRHIQHDALSAPIVAKLLALGRQNPLLLASQVLFLITANAAYRAKLLATAAVASKTLEGLVHVAGALLVQVLHAEVPRKVAQFATAAATRTLSAVTYFSVWSLANMLVGCQAKGGQPGREAAKGMNLKQKFELLGRHTHRSAVTATVCKATDGFLSIILLAYAITLHPDGAEGGPSAHALRQAFFGCRVPESETPAGEVRLTSKGKACKRIVQLMPYRGVTCLSPQFVLAPVLAALSWLLDKVVFLKTNVGDLDIQSYCNSEVETPAADVDDDESDYYLYQRQRQQQQQLQPKVRFDGIPHLLQLVIHLAGHMPIRELCPSDKKEESAICFFLFHNALEHLWSAFDTHGHLQQQQQQHHHHYGREEPWEPQLLKLYRAYLQAVTAVAADPICAAMAKAVLLPEKDATTYHHVMWETLLKQARDCARTAADPTAVAASGAAVAATALAAHPYGRRQNPRAVALHSPQALSIAAERRAYTARQQQRFTVAIAQLCHALLAHKIHLYDPLDAIRDIKTEMAETAVMTQAFLGASLALLASSATTFHLGGAALQEKEGLGVADASQWDVELWHLLSSLGVVAAESLPWNTASTSSALHAPLAPSASAAAAAAAGDATATAVSLLGHCAHEARTGVYDITIGLLQLLTVLFHFPSSENVAPQLAKLVGDVAEHILCGWHAREFLQEEQRHVVMALASSILARSFALQLVPLSVIMKSNLAPSDVLGELLRVVAEVQATPDCDLTHAAVVSARSVLSLLLLYLEAEAVSDRGQQHFAFEYRTLTNFDLAKHLLVLACSPDAEISISALVLLSKINPSNINDAVRDLACGNANAHLSASASSATPIGMAGPEIVRTLTAILSPDYVAPAINLGVNPLALRFLQDAFRSNRALSPITDGLAATVSSDDLRQRQQAALLDLLLLHAQSVPQPVLLLWLFGFPDLHRMGIVVNATPHDPRHLRKGHLLESVLACANGPDFVAMYPNLAAKSIELLYRMYAMPYVNTAPFRRELSSADAQAFVKTLANMSSALVSTRNLELLGFTMRFVALDTFVHFQPDVDLAGQHSPSLELVHNLFQRVVGAPLFDQVGREGHTTHEGPTIEAARWLALVLRALPAFPTLNVPGGVDTKVFYARREGSGLQIDIAQVQQAFEAAAAGAVGTPESIKDRVAALVQPFMQANEIAKQYESFANFVEGWCGMIGVAVCKMPAMEPENIILFILSITEALPYTQVATLGTRSFIVAELCKTIALLASCLCTRCSPNVATRVSNATHRTAFPTTTTRGTMSSAATTARPRLAVHLIRADVNHTIAALLKTLVGWCANDGTSRMQLYNALDLILAIPHVPVDEELIYQARKPVFDLLLADLREAETVPRQLAALALLRRLVLMPRLAEGFCVAPNPMCPSAAAIHFLATVTELLDRQVSAFVLRRPVDAQEALGGLLMQIDTTCQILALLAQEHAALLFRAAALSKVCRMQCWQECAKVLIGHVTYAPEGGDGHRNLLGGGSVGSSSGTAVAGGRSGSVHLCRDLVRRLLSAVLQWVNTMLVTLAVHDDAVNEIASFVRNNKTLVQFALSAPLSIDSVISTTSLRLLQEASLLLVNLSMAPFVAAQCRALTSIFSLPQLLFTLSSQDLCRRACFCPDSDDGAAIYVGQVHPSEGTVPSQLQQVLLSKAAQNVAAFLLNAEYPLVNGDLAPEDPAAPPGVVQDPTIMFLLADIMGHLAQCADKRKPPTTSMSVAILAEKVAVGFIAAIQMLGSFMGYYVLSQQQQQQQQSQRRNPQHGDFVAVLRERTAMCESAVKGHVASAAEQQQGRASEASKQKIIPDSFGRKTGRLTAAPHPNISANMSRGSLLDADIVDTPRFTDTSLFGPDSHRQSMLDAEAAAAADHLRKGKQYNIQLQQCLSVLFDLRRLIDRGL